jgi:hypothetical protein
MNDSTIQMIAQAVIANTKVIQSLIDALPHDAKVAVAEIASPVPAPAPAPVAMPAPAPAPAPVAMPAPPMFAAPAPAPATAAAAPFTDVKGMIDYVMGVYRELGPQKGAQIQNVLTGLGYQNINDVKPEHYSALFQGVEQLKVA